MKSMICFGAVLAVCGAAAEATTVTGGSLLTTSDAVQLETWLGAGTGTFSLLWRGTDGAPVADFHSAVDGAGATFAIFAIDDTDVTPQLIGGYTSVDYGTPGNTYFYDPTAFIFNLTSGEVQTIQHDTRSVRIGPDYFPTFGYGHDLFGGTVELQSYRGAVSYADGYSYSLSYDLDQGQIAIAGDSGVGDGSSGTNFQFWYLTALEVYSFAPAVSAEVPVPASLPLLLAGLGAIGFVRHRRRPA